MATRKSIELAVGGLLVAGYLLVPIAILPHVCLSKTDQWSLKFWCEVNASDFFVGLFTLLLGIATYFLWRETERLAVGADDQANKMERSISEAARAASAMEGVATSIAANAVTASNMAAMQREFWQRQMRAYVSVVVGAATYQDRANILKFAGRPRIVNEGMTPAYNLKTAIKAAIVDFPVAANFNFDLPEATAQNNPAVGPRQYRDVTGIVADYVPDQDVAGIKDLSSRKALLVWGKVTYDDAFGTGRYANFAQVLYWNPDNSVMGMYEDRHNNSD